MIKPERALAAASEHNTQVIDKDADGKAATDAGEAENKARASCIGRVLKARIKRSNSSKRRGKHLAQHVTPLSSKVRSQAS